MSYLLNLCGDFEAGNILPAFLPYTAGGNIQLFEEITQHALPETDQEEAINFRLRSLKNHYDDHRLCLSSDSEAPEIGIILGYDDWPFTGYGQLSRWPIFKFKYLRKKINDLFKKQKNSLEIVYFITGLKSKPYVAIFNHIEKTGYCPESNELPSVSIDIHWIKRSVIKAAVTDKVRNEKTLRGDDSITDAMNESIRKFKEKWKDCLNKSFQDLQFRDKSSTNEILDKVEKSLSHIKTIDQYNAVKFMDVADEYFNKYFSTYNNLMTNETAFKYIIDDSNASANIRSKYGLACLALESLVNKVFSESEVRYHQVKSISIDEAKWNLYFAILNNITESSLQKLIRTDENSLFKYLKYNIPENDLTKTYPDINRECQLFTSYDDIKKSIGRFFYSGIRSDIKALFTKRIQIKEIESKVFSLVGMAFIVPDLTEEYCEKKEETLFKIKETLNESILNLPKLVSTIDHDAYYGFKHITEPLIHQKQEEVLNELKVLPRLSHATFVIGCSTLAVMLFCLPLYTFIFPLHAMMAALAFLLLSIIVFVILIQAKKKKIDILLDELEVESKKLCEELNKFRGEIIKVANTYRNTIIERKNIEVLQNLVNEQNEDNLRKNEYLGFLRRLKGQIGDIKDDFSGDGMRPMVEIKIDDLTFPPILNPSFKGILNDKANQKILIRYPSREPIGMEIEHHTFIKQVEFE